MAKNTLPSGQETYVDGIPLVSRLKNALKVKEPETNKKIKRKYRQYNSTKKADQHLSKGNPVKKLKESKLLLEFLTEKPIFSFRKKEWLCDEGDGTISGRIKVTKGYLDAHIKIQEEYGEPCRVSLSAYSTAECPDRLKRMRTITQFMESYKKKYDKAVADFIKEHDENKNIP